MENKTNAIPKRQIYCKVFYSNIKQRIFARLPLKMTRYQNDSRRYKVIRILTDLFHFYYGWKIFYTIRMENEFREKKYINIFRYLFETGEAIFHFQ